MTRTELIKGANDFNRLANATRYPLYKCNAVIYEVVPRKCYILRSYQTVVAVADCWTAYHRIYVFDYYSAMINGTHISRFAKWLKQHTPFGWQETIPLYKNSKMSKRAFELYSKNDWANVIYNHIGYEDNSGKHIMY